MATSVSSPESSLGYPGWRVVLHCWAVFGLASASLGLLTPQLWHLYAVFFVIGVVGNGTTQMGFSGAVSLRFAERRGLALALIMARAGLGSIVLPPLAQALLDAYGWRTAYFALGGLALSMSLPLAARYLRANPAAGRRGPGLGGRLLAGDLLDRFWGPLISCLLLVAMATGRRT